MWAQALCGGLPILGRLVVRVPVHDGAAITDDTGLVSVPIKPTTAMLTAGARSGHVSVETAWKIYQAMINEEN